MRSQICSAFIAVVVAGCAANDSDNVNSTGPKTNLGPATSSSFDLSATGSTQLPGQVQKLKAYLKKQNSKVIPRDYVYDGVIWPHWPNRFGMALSADANYMAIGSQWGGAGVMKDGRQVCASGSIDTYKNRDGRWEFMSTLDAPSRGPQPTDECSAFGLSLATNGGTLATSDSSKELALKNIIGRVAIYSVDASGKWVFRQFLLPWPVCGQKMLTSDNQIVCTALPQLFGTQIKIAGDQMAISQPGGIGTLGFVYLYERGSDGMWKFSTRLETKSTAGSTRFGQTLAIARDMLVVSDVDFSMAVYEKRAGKWQKTAGLLPHYGKKLQPDFWQFGFASGLATNGQMIAVGAVADKASLKGVFSRLPSPDESVPASGAVFVYRKANGKWTQSHYVKPVDGATRQFFGSGIAMSANRMVVGAFGDPYLPNNSNKGYYVYDLNESDIILKSIIRPPAASSATVRIDVGFGRRVELVGKDIIVSDHHERSGQRINRYDGNTNTDASVLTDGAVYVFGDP
jgi:hypothetical protein